MAAFPLQTVLGEDRHSWSVNLPASYCLCRDADHARRMAISPTLR